MTRRNAASFVFAALIVAGCDSDCDAPPGQGGRWIDVSHPGAPHVIDGRFSADEWAHVPPMEGVLTDFYADARDGYLYVLNDWRANTETILPGCHNYFRLVIDGQPIEVRVYGDGSVSVSGAELDGEGAYGFGPSARYPYDHTIYEFRVELPPGASVVNVCAKDPVSGSSCEEHAHEPCHFQLARAGDAVRVRRTVPAEVARIAAGLPCGELSGICADGLFCMPGPSGHRCAPPLASTPDAGIDAGLDAGVDAGPPAPTTCFDGELGGDETDVDCGGACAPCVDGAICATDLDCASRSCVDDRCATVDFGCGDERCAAGAELCELSETPRCEPLPDGCLECACLELASFCECTEDPPGALRVQCSLP